MSKNTDKHISLSLPASSQAETAAAGPKGIAIKPGQMICGELEMRIDRGGVWYYLGSPIGRKELVRLFSTVLRRDDDGDYWLITPAEVGRIAVDDAPFLAVEMTVTGVSDEQIITLRTNMDALVIVDDDHPIRNDINPDTNEPSPYLVMDGGIEALITRAVYYELVALGHEKEKSLGVWSSGSFFLLGTLGDKEAGP